MTLKEELHELVDELNEEQVGRAHSYIQSLLRHTSTSKEDRSARIRAACGSMAHLPGGTEDFMRRKQEDIELEEEQFLRRHPEMR